MGLFPDSNALSCAVANLAAVQEISVVIETSYFLDTKRGARNPAGVEIVRDGALPRSTRIRSVLALKLASIVPWFCANASYLVWPVA